MLKWNLSIKSISFYIFIIPTITVILSYFFSLYLDLVPSCFPMFEGCTSISRTGRYYPVNIFFKSFMFLSGAFILLYWFKNYSFFQTLKNSYLIKATYFFGVISIIFLFLYLIFLGENDYYRFFRKIGIFIFLLFSIISELLLSIIYRLNHMHLSFNKIAVKYKLILSLFLVSIGIILLPFMIMKIENVSNLRNIISWNFFLFIQFNFLLTFIIWKK